jgi:hypothetical protein
MIIIIKHLYLFYSRHISNTNALLIIVGKLGQIDEHEHEHLPCPGHGRGAVWLRPARPA